MNILEVFYDSNYQVKTNPRKEEITSRYTQIIAPHNCGKTYFILDFINTHFKPKEYLYIDCTDMRTTTLLTKEIINFIQTNSIEIIIFDNYNIDFNIDFERLRQIVENIVISSTKAIELIEFKNIYLSPLDFEQFLLFGNYENSKIAFNNFLKHGNFPISSHLEEAKQINYLQNLIKINAENDTKLYIKTILYEYISQKRSLLELFQKTKEKTKVSKDTFYSYVKYLEDINEIYLVPNYFKPQAVKKIFAYNPALFGAVSIAKKFNNILTNYIFLELKYRFDDIYYLDDIDFFIPKDSLIVICMPFITPEILSKKSSSLISVIQEKRISIKNIQIVTNSTEDTIFIDDIECEIIPFHTWALSF